MTRKLSLKDVVAELVGPATIRRQALDIKGPSPSPFGAFRLRVHSKDMAGRGQGALRRKRVMKQRFLMLAIAAGDPEDVVGPAVVEMAGEDEQVVG